MTDNSGKILYDFRGNPKLKFVRNTIHFEVRGKAKTKTISAREAYRFFGQNAKNDFIGEVRK